MTETWQDPRPSHLARKADNFTLTTQNTGAYRPFRNSLPLDEDMPTEQYRDGVSLGGFRDGVRVRG